MLSLRVLVRNKRLRDESVWQAAIKGRVLDGRHRWAPPPTDVAPLRRNEEMDPALFELDPKDGWARLDAMVSASNPDWYSPGAQRLNEPWADEAVWDTCSRDQNFAGLSEVWMNDLFSGAEIVVRDKTEACGGGAWLFPFCEAGTFSWWAWRLQAFSEGLPHFNFVPVDSSTALGGHTPYVAIFVRNIDDWEAMEYTWASPLHIGPNSQPRCTCGRKAMRLFDACLHCQSPAL